MSFLLDTHVVSEAKKPEPDSAVMKWLAAQDINDVYLSVMTLGELEEGISQLGRTKKATALRQWHRQLQVSFKGRILAIDAETSSTMVVISKPQDPPGTLT